MTEPNPAGEKKLFIDEDWKSQVAAEKQRAEQERLAREASGTSQEARAGEPGTGKPSTESLADEEPPAHAGGEVPHPEGLGTMPPASLMILISSLATEAMMAMGQFPNPMTGEISADKEQAQYAIDLLEVLREKTKGNLDPEEESTLRDVLHQLRMAFISS
jgi:hypothetical protein